MTTKQCKSDLFVCATVSYCLVNIVGRSSSSSKATIVNLGSSSSDNQFIMSAVNVCVL